MQPPSPTALLRDWRERLSARVSGQSLAMFRILFGALVFVDFLRFIWHDRLWRYWIAPDFHFPYAGFSWVGPPSEAGVQLAWTALGIAALLVTLGLFYRVAIVVMTVLFAWFFLMDAAEYLNHFYLVLLYAILLCFLPANRIWSLDALIFPRDDGDRTVPHAAVFVLRIQTEIVLIYAGLVKLTPDWLAGEPLGLWMRERVQGMWLEPVMQLDWLIILACWTVIALHVLGAPLLMWRRTRLPVFLVYCLFHIGNAWSFNIGIFPWLTIAASTIFFDPDWPSRLLGRQAVDVPRPTPPCRPLPLIAVIAIALWVVVQIALPVRGVLFDSEIRWSGDGHRYSWRMRIFDRYAEGHFIVTDRGSGRQWLVDPYDYLTERQAGTMLTRADMIHGFAAHIAGLWRAEGRDVSVQAHICKSLNGRPAQYFIDPQTDLTVVRVNRFSADPWVLPLEVSTWGVRDNSRADTDIEGWQRRATCALADPLDG